MSSQNNTNQFSGRSTGLPIEKISNYLDTLTNDQLDAVDIDFKVLRDLIVLIKKKRQDKMFYKKYIVSWPTNTVQTEKDRNLSEIEDN